MKHRIVSGLVLVPLMIVLSTTPAYAIFGSILAAIQRAQMIVNQGVQIYNDAMEKITMNGQLTELTDQFSHLKEQALGTVGALSQPFTDLSSIPTEFIGAGLVLEERLYRRGRGVGRGGGAARRIGDPVSPTLLPPTANSPATPVKSFFQDNPSPINSVGTELRSVKGCESARPCQGLALLGARIDRSVPLAGRSS